MKSINNVEANNIVRIIIGSSMILMCLFGALQSCETDAEETAETDGKITLDDVRWLEGTWIDRKKFGFKEPPLYMMETWKSYPDSLSGAGYSIQVGDTVLMELISLQMVNDKLTYVARPKDQAMVAFSLIPSTDGSFVFENKANDFPQKLTYLKMEGDSLSITLDGIHNTANQTVTFKYEKE